MTKIFVNILLLKTIQHTYLVSMVQKKTETAALFINEITTIIVKSSTKYFLPECTTDLSQKT